MITTFSYSRLSWAEILPIIRTLIICAFWQNLFASDNDVNKKDRPNTTPTVVPFVHLQYIFRSFDLFVASLLFMKGISYCVIRRKLEPLDRAKANFTEEVIGLHDFRCYLRVPFVEFDTSIIYHLLVYCFGSFLLED